MEYKSVDPGMIERFSEAYRNSDLSRAMTNIFAKNDCETFGYSPLAARGNAFRFSYEIPTMRPADQKHSGRCWLFAALNILRERIGKTLNVEYFELSQSYLAFWDKFERCNYFLNSVIETAGLPLQEETVRWLMDNTFGGDAGQWDMFVNIVKKYGLVPKDAMPETQQTGATGKMNGHLTAFMRVSAARLRKMANGGASAEALAAAKNEALCSVYDFLCRCFTEPPERFDLEYVDKEKVRHIRRDYTPISFRDQFVGDMLDDYVSVINSPTADKPFGRFYTVRFLGNIAEGKPILYYNVSIKDLKALVLRQLMDGELVWFGSDSAKFRDKEKCFWDDRCFNDPLFTGLPIRYDKETALDYGISCMIHAMVLTGVNIDERTGCPDRWKIENSYGPEGANDGYWFCTDTWFERFVYQAVIHKKYLTADPAHPGEIISLAPWDPMGTLAD